MKLYKDKELTEEVNFENIDLGDVRAGESKTFSFYLHNPTESTVKGLRYEIQTVKEVSEGRDYSKCIEEFSIEKFPTELSPNSFNILEFKWSPKVDIKRGLKLGISIYGHEIYI